MITRTPELDTDWEVLNGTTIRSHDREFDTEIGDAMQPDFYPQVKLKRWDNKFNFSIRPVLPDFVTTRLEIEGNKISASIAGYEFNFWFDGGPQFEIVIPSRPPRNYIDFTVNTKLVVLNHQPPLTQQEVRDGNVKRPDKVVNSIAIYAVKRNNAYKNGKMCHLYRPLVTDAALNEFWGDWEVIDNNNIRLSVANKTLNSAIYPIKIR